MGGVNKAPLLLSSQPQGIPTRVQELYFHFDRNLARPGSTHLHFSEIPLLLKEV